MATKPSSIVSSAMTLARTGRSMKNFAIMAALPSGRDLVRRRQWPLSRRHEVAGYGVLQPIDDDLTVRIEAGGDGAQSVLDRTGLDALLLHLVVRTDDEEITPDLVAAHHPVGYHQLRYRLGERDAHLCKESRQQ